MTALAPFAGALASAILLGACALLDGPSWVLAFVALVPWILGLERARSLGAALASGLLLSCGMAASAFYWFPPAVGGYAGGSSVVGWVILLALAPILVEPQFIAAAAARHLVARRGRPALAAAAAVLLYAGVEWVWPKLFGDTLGVGLYPETHLRQAADLAGVRGLTLLVLVANEGVAALFRRRVRLAAVAAALAGAAWAYGAWRLSDLERRMADAPRLRAGLVQANITKYDKMAAAQGAYQTVATILDTHFELSERLLSEGPLDAILWPETMYPTTFGAPKTEDAAAFDRAIAGFAAVRHVALVFGAFEKSEIGEHNAIFFLTPAEKGVEVASYEKTMLFPMTEHVPSWLDSAWLRRKLPWAGRWTPGPGPRAVPVRLGGRTVSVGPLICYEVIDSDYVAAEARAGAELLVTLSNDAWFTSADGPRLHILTAAMRSVETRRPQLRATNSGISALILPTGDLVDATAFDARAALRVEAPLIDVERTPVVRWGDWLGLPCLLGGLLAIAWGVLRRGHDRPHRAARHR